ncbi:MAG: hypothetical protein LLF92_08450 [Planctomycetaceae bacterium]|nr:hypothetical protein [Planctomycetaceae bacterium]
MSGNDMKISRRGLISDSLGAAAGLFAGVNVFTPAVLAAQAAGNYLAACFLLETAFQCIFLKGLTIIASSGYTTKT